MNSPIKRFTDKWPLPIKKAVATFVFATTGTVVGGSIFDYAIWKGAAAAGIGALVNFAYRWSEQYLATSTDK